MLHGNTASTEGHGHYCGCLDPGSAKKRREWKEGGGERMQRKGRGKEKGNSWYLLKGAENLHPHKTCRRMFIAASKTWRQQRCLSVSEWLNKLW